MWRFARTGPIHDKRGLNWGQGKDEQRIIIIIPGGNIEYGIGNEMTWQSDCTCRSRLFSPFFRYLCHILHHHPLKYILCKKMFWSQFLSSHPILPNGNNFLQRQPFFIRIGDSGNCSLREQTGHSHKLMTRYIFFLQKVLSCHTYICITKCLLFKIVIL